MLVILSKVPSVCESVKLLAIEHIYKVKKEQLEEDRDLIKCVHYGLTKKNYENLNIIEKHEIENTLREFRRNEDKLNELRNFNR